MALLPQNQRDQIMVAVCVLSLGLAGAYWYLMWAPKNVELATMQAHVDTLVAQNQLAQKEIASGSATKLKDEADKYGRLLILMRQLVPTANEVPTLLEQISTAARQTGMDIGDVTPLGVIGGDVFDTYRYKIGITGSYHRIGQLLSNIGSLGRIVAPMNLSLLPTARDQSTLKRRPGEANLDATFDIQTYVARAPLPAQAGVATKVR